MFESKSVSKALEILLVKGFLLKSEQLGGTHPLGRGIRRASNHREAVGQDLDLRLGRLGLYLDFRTGEPAFQQLRRHILEFPTLMHRPEFQLPNEFWRKIEGRFHEGILLVFWFAVKTSMFREPSPRWTRMAETASRKSSPRTYSLR
jgi:hypothetical protein